MMKAITIQSCIEFLRSNYIILLLITFALFLRLVLLGTVPPGLSNDESNVILNAQSLVNTYKNIPGVVTGLLGIPTGSYNGGGHSELSSYFLAAFYTVTGFTIQTVKIPFVVSSMGVVILMYLITKKLVNRTAAILVLLFGMINPWLINFGRSGFESIISAFFYFLAIYLTLIFDGKKIIVAWLFLLAGFFSYFSAKTLFLPLVVLMIIIVKLFKPKESLKPLIVLLIISTIFVVFYGIALKSTGVSSRLDELNGSLSEKVPQIVIKNRTASIDSPFSEIVENRYTQELRYRLIAGLGTFSPVFIFINGSPESSGHLSIPDHGPLYVMDFLFVITGLIFLAKYNINIFVIFLYMILITFIPNFLNISGTTYSMRPVILYPTLTILVGIGVYGTYKLIPKKVQFFYIGAIFLVYTFLFLNFTYQYYFRLPINNNDAFFFHDRIASKYIQETFKENPSTKVVWVTNLTHFSFYRYIFFSGLYSDRDNIKAINSLLGDSNYKIGNVTFTSICPEEFRNDFIYIVDVYSECKVSKIAAVIANINDAGEKYKLVNDPLCEGYKKNNYSLIKKFQQLNVESLYKQEFCETYILGNQKGS